MSRRVIALNVAIGLIAVALGTVLVRELSSRRAIPSPGARAGQAATQPAAGPPAATKESDRDPLSAYNIVATRNLFSPSRSETPPPTVAAPVAPQAAKPILHGVIIDEAKSRAWLEDPTTKRTYGYALGDTVSGGRLERIAADRVVIARPEGSVEVLLRDPTKPRPPPPQAATPPTRGRAPVPGSTPGTRPAQPAVPGAPQPGAMPGIQGAAAPPQPLPVPPQLLRRRGIATPPVQPDDDDE